MISYIEIANRIKEKQTQKKKKDRKSPAPISCIADKVPPFNESACLQTTKQKIYWKIRLIRILTFIKRYDSVKDKCVIIPISTRASDNLAIWETHQGVSKAIHLMRKIGILRLEDDSYRFGHSVTKECRTYRYYKHNAEKFIRFCEEHYVTAIPTEGLFSENTATTNEFTDFDRTKVAFCSNLKLFKPQNITKKNFAKFLEDCLYENYPQLAYYQKVANEINKTYYKNDNDLRIKFKPHFTWKEGDKYISKIGIRATCLLDNKRKADRPQILKDYGFDKEKDIKSSVPRVTLSLTNGEWFSDNVDLYKKIYDNSEQDKVFPDDEFPDEMREAIKQLFMRAYFDSTEKKMVHHIWREMIQEGVSKQDVTEQMIKLRNGIHKTCGAKPKGTEIFLAESCVYLRVLQRLLQDGRKGWLLYDAFYCCGLEDESNEQFDEIAEKYLKESFSEYLKISKKSIK